MASAATANGTTRCQGKRSSLAPALLTRLLAYVGNALTFSIANARSFAD